MAKPRVMAFLFNYKDGGRKFAGEIAECCIKLGQSGKVPYNTFNDTECKVLSICNNWFLNASLIQSDYSLSDEVVYLSDRVAFVGILSKEEFKNIRMVFLNNNVEIRD